jgi:hypothetical protein
VRGRLAQPSQSRSAIECLALGSLRLRRSSGRRGWYFKIESSGAAKQRGARVRPRQPGAGRTVTPAGRTVAPRTAHSVVLCAHLAQHRVSARRRSVSPNVAGELEKYPAATPARVPSSVTQPSYTQKEQNSLAIPVFPATPCGATSARAWPRQSAGEVSALSHRLCRGSLRYKSY